MVLCSYFMYGVSKDSCACQPYLYLSTLHLGVIKNLGQYCSISVLVVSISGNPLETASLDNPYCLARYLLVSCSTVPRLPTSSTSNLRPLTGGSPTDALAAAKAALTAAKVMQVPETSL